MSKNKLNLTPTIDPATAVPHTGRGLLRGIAKFLTLCMGKHDSNNGPTDPLYNRVNLGNKGYPGPEDNCSEWVNASPDE